MPFQFSCMSTSWIFQIHASDDPVFELHPFKLWKLHFHRWQLLWRYLLAYSGSSVVHMAKRKFKKNYLPFQEKFNYIRARNFDMSPVWWGQGEGSAAIECLFPFFSALYFMVALRSYKEHHPVYLYIIHKIFLASLRRAGGGNFTADYFVNK